MPRKAKSNGPSPLATVPVALPGRQITRAQANELLKARALELYHNARTQRDEHIRAFEAEYGRADRVDHTVLADLQRTQARLAAIAARQQRSNASGAEPKVAKFVDQIGTMIGSISAHLATERALELFAPVSQADYVGWNGGAIGPKGHDDSILSGYEIVDDALGATNAVPTIDEDGKVCLHAEIEPFEDESSRGACTDCGEEFAINTDSSRRQYRFGGRRCRRRRHRARKDGQRPMERQAAPAARRSSLPSDFLISPAFVRHAHALAIARTARDAHRGLCELDAVECDACRAHARSIAHAKWKLNHLHDLE